MGGAIKAVGRGLGAVATGGLSEIAPKSLFGKAGNTIGNVLTLGGAHLGGSGGSSGVPGAGGQVSPMENLQLTGGAPLLASIAMGVDPASALMSYFGASGDFSQWKATLDPQSQQAVDSLHGTLTQISNSTDMKTKAVQNLVQDFPNFMKSAIPQFTGIMDEQTKAAAQRALDQTAAKYAAGGMLSSGATAEALARTGALTEQKNLEMGGNLALENWTQRFNQSNALLSFQQKMLGQGASEGFNAIQNMLAINAKAGLQTQGLQAGQNVADQAAQQGMWGSIGKLGGTIAGSAFGGPIGGAIGGAVGGNLASGVSGNMSPRLNMPGFTGGANPFGGSNG